jgi:hypothetical protein
MKKSNIKPIYIVKYRFYYCDEESEVNIFVTRNKSKASKYSKRFNSILKKWKGYYSQFEMIKGGMIWIADEHMDKFDRWERLRSFDRCWVEQIEER